MSETPTVRTKAFLPNGRWVEYIIPAADIADMIAKTFELDKALESAGLLLREPGLEQGEIRETFTYISRRAKTNDDNEDVPLIDLYPDKFDYASLKVYLNNAQQVAAFEAAAGIKLTDIPLNPNHKNAAARNDAQDARYILLLPKPLVAIKKKNPAYNPDETDLKKKKPQWLFVRWADQPASQPADNGSALSDAEKLAALRKRVHAEVNSKLTDEQIAKYGDVARFNDLEAWKAKHKSFDNAVKFIQSNYQFDLLVPEPEPVADF